LPGNERVLWTGRPAWRPLARHLFKIRTLGAYFAVLAVWAFAVILLNGVPPRDALLATLIPFVPLTLLALALVLAAARLVASTTRYFVTERRVILLIGVAITKTVNIPLAKIANVAIRERPDGTADIALTLEAGARVGFLTLFPHVRAGSLFAPRPQPMLRGCPDGREAAEVLTVALMRSSGGVRHDIEVPAVPAGAIPEAAGV
jgi:hypothetical protein